MCAVGFDATGVLDLELARARVIAHKNTQSSMKTCFHSFCYCQSKRTTSNASVSKRVAFATKQPVFQGQMMTIAVCYCMEQKIMSHYLALVMADTIQVRSGQVNILRRNGYFQGRGINMPSVQVSTLMIPTVLY